MWIAVAVVVGSVAAWIAVDQWRLSRNIKMRRGATAWADLGAPGAVFHSTGFEETLPPALAARAQRIPPRAGTAARRGTTVGATARR